LDYSQEWQHLRQPTDEDRDKLNTKVEALYKEGKSIRETAALLEVSRAKVERILKPIKQ